MQSRRTLMAEVAAIPLSNTVQYGIVQQPDAMRDLIRAYQTGIEQCLGAGGCVEESSWHKHFDEICLCPPPIESVEGALAAAGMLRAEATDYLGSPAIVPLAGAIERFLKLCIGLAIPCSWEPCL